jgi:homoserine dehydrogenase
MNLINKNEKPQDKKNLLKHLGQVRENLIQKINYHAKEDIFKTLEKVQYFSGEMFKINLEIISKKKDLVYSNKKLIADRGRGDLSHVQRAKTESFWSFDGPFWADELGDYSFGLKSNCQTIRREGEEK